MFFVVGVSDCYSRKITMGRELMAPRTDRTTRIPSGVASPVTTSHAAKGSVLVNLRNGCNLNNWPKTRFGTPAYVFFVVGVSDSIVKGYAEDLQVLSYERGNPVGYAADPSYRGTSLVRNSPTCSSWWVSDSIVKGYAENLQVCPLIAFN